MPITNKLHTTVAPQTAAPQCAEPEIGLKDDLKTVGDIFKNPIKSLDTSAERKQAKDAFINLGGAAVGYAGIMGLRYPVTEYQTKVSDGLWRGSRLDEKDVAALKQQGIKSLVALTRESNSDEPLAKAAGMNYLRVSIIDNTAPTFAQMKDFLDFVTAPENQPAYVHCQAGKGRTGVAVACYRMAVQGWSTDKALAEAIHAGMAVPDQQAFVRAFGDALKTGCIEGYPLKQVA